MRTTTIKIPNQTLSVLLMQEMMVRLSSDIAHESPNANSSKDKDVWDEDSQYLEFLAQEVRYHTSVD